MRFINKEFLKNILISKRAIDKASRMVTESPILFQSIVIFGLPGSGKSNCANYIVREARKYYGASNVNARYVSGGEIEYLLRWGIEPKLVNILFCDNATLRKIPSKYIQEYFKIRHHPVLSNQDKGYVLSIIAIHRFHGCQLEIRTTMDGLIVLDSSMNPYDNNILKRLVGEDVIAFFDKISDRKKENLELKGIAYYKSKSIEGFIKIPFVKKRYLKHVLEL